MKLFIALSVALLFCLDALAVCTDGRIGIEIHLTEKTLEMANALPGEPIPFQARKGDAILIYEDYYKGIPGRKEMLKYGYISTDGAGNFSLKAVSFAYNIPIYMIIDHDHEVSYEEGIHGWYRNYKGQDFNLRSLKCHYHELFLTQKTILSS